MDCPVRHGEGKYVMPDSDSLEALSNNNQIVVRYVDPKLNQEKVLQTRFYLSQYHLMAV